MVPVAGVHRLPAPEADPQDWPRSGRDIPFSELVDRHAQELFALAHAMLGNRDDAEEALQETFLGAYRGLPGFAGRSSAKTWLTAILVRQVARVRRSHARRRQIPLDDRTDDAAVRVQSAALRSAAAMDLRSLLERLTPDHRDVLVLREMRGMSYDEISAVLGLPRGTVESRIHRARQALRHAAAGPERQEGSDARNE